MNDKINSLNIRFIALLLLIVFNTTAYNAFSLEPQTPIPGLDNPISVRYLRKTLNKTLPRLVLNASAESNLREKLRTDPVVQNMYKAVKLNAAEIQKKPLLKYVKKGRRILSVSREMLYRVNMLGMVYRIDRDRSILQRLNDEAVTVCSFSDWNPSHFLDTAEMSMAVAFALDWTAGKLPTSTIVLCQNALIEKGIKPSWSSGNSQPSWVYGNNNWNQVCNGGMIAASIAIAEKDPHLAAKTIWRALDGLPNALAEYMPDGVYPEGPTYWEYGTGFSVTTAAILESAFGTDFGYSNYPGFMESAVFRLMSNAPSGLYYNYADSGNTRARQGDEILAWFATRTGNKTFFERERFLMPPEKMGKLSRLTGAALVWLAQYEEKFETKIPTAWKGNGANPVVVFTGEENDPHSYYFGGKGGFGATSHGNMDAGSFVFELNGVRWVLDPGNQDYYVLERSKFNLWSRCQNCQRWTLLTKNNFGHSTITVNDQLHAVRGHAKIINFKSGEKPEATINMTSVFQGLLKSAKRRFIKDTDASLIIEDTIETSAKTNLITWQLLTTADVEIVKGGAVLKQNGEVLNLENLSHPNFMVSVIALNPAPQKLDLQIKRLKRIEIRIPAWTVKNKKEKIIIRLSGKPFNKEETTE